jgi:hypothetical protein
VYGLGLSVTTDSESVVRVVDSVLAPFSVASVEPAKTCKVVINGGKVSKEVACPAGMRKFWSGTLLDGSKMVHWTGKGIHQLDVLGLASTFIDIPSQRARITVCGGGQWCIDGGLLLLVLSEFLRDIGHYVIHAASLVCNKNGGNKGILIAGGGGKGKTTTALALGGAGMKLLADDLSFVTDDPANGLVVWGLQKACKVHHKTLKMLKWLQDLPQRPAIRPDEVLVDVSKHFGCTRPIKVVPKVIIFLNDRNMKEHHINPLDKVDAIKILAGENVRAFDSNARGAIGETFRMLGALVRYCDCYSLSAGPDVAGLYEIVTALLR